MIFEFFSQPAIWIVLFNALALLLSLLLMNSGTLKAKFFSAPVLVQKFLVFIDVAPLLAIPAVPQPRFSSSNPVLYTAGAVLILCAIVLWVLALRKIGVVPSIREKKNLLTDGIYGVIRNPLYAGNILLAFGAAMAFHSYIALCYAPVVAVLYALLCLVEEKGLADDYGDEFSSYRERTPYRLVPYLF